PDIETIISPLGETLVAANLFATGATSDVWKIQTNRRTYALKHLNKRATSTDVALDVHIRTTLSENGAHVAAPILSSSDFPNLSGAAWTLDEFVDGTYPIVAISQHKPVRTWEKRWHFCIAFR
ncbi:MAG: hypothetical protein ACTSRN_04370, partial [Alphaproteobacteria bacterium]